MSLNPEYLASAKSAIAMIISAISGLVSTNSCNGLNVKKKYEIIESRRVSSVKFKAVLTLFPSCTLVKSSDNKIKIKTAKIGTLNGNTKIPTKTPTATPHNIKAMRGKYCSLSLSLRKRSRIKVETATIIKKSPIPITGPVATKLTARAAGKKIPNPLIPTTLREKAIINAINGNKRSSIIVDSGTPETIAFSINGFIPILYPLLFRLWSLCWGYSPCP